MSISIDLSDRRALVTGSGQGIGRGIARTLARAGADVVVNDLVAERAAAVAAEIVAEGGAASVSAFDVTDWGAVQAALEQIEPIDLLVNNAGNAGRADSMGFEDLRPFAEEDPAVWEGFIGVNLRGVMHLTRSLLPSMIERQRGRIVTIVSDASRTGDANLAAYAAAKAGAAGLTRSVAREVGRHGITANCIALGSINQEEWPPDVEEERVGWLIRRYPIRRRGLPADVANLTLFLVSDLSPWLTGQTIPLNGGYSMAL